MGAYFYFHKEKPEDGKSTSNAFDDDKYSELLIPYEDFGCKTEPLCDRPEDSSDFATLITREQAIKIDDVLDVNKGLLIDLMDSINQDYLWLVISI